MNRGSFIRNSLLMLGAGPFAKALKIDRNGLLNARLGEQLHEAMYYRPTQHGVKCTLCPEICGVHATKEGNCRVRYFSNGKLYTRGYGNPVHVAVTKPEKVSISSYLKGQDVLLIGTGGCNLHCLFCNVSAASQGNYGDLKTQSLQPDEVIELALRKSVKGIVYGYTEPVVFYEYMLHIARLARQKGLKNLMTTNGYINPEPLSGIIEYLDAVVVDVKGFSDATYQRLASGIIVPVFDTIRMLHSRNVHLEISHLLVPGWTDDLALLQKMGEWMTKEGLQQVPFHINRFRPSYKLHQLQAATDDQLQAARRVLQSAGLLHTDTVLS